MRKMYVASIAALLCFLTISVYANVAQYLNAEVVNYKLQIDGKQKAIDEPIVTINNKTYVPLKSLSELMRCKVDWDEDQQQISIDTRSSRVPREYTKEELIDIALPLLEIKDRNGIEVKSINYRDIIFSKSGETVFNVELEVDKSHYKTSLDFQSAKRNIEDFEGMDFYKVLKDFKDKAVKKGTGEFRSTFGVYEGEEYYTPYNFYFVVGDSLTSKDKVSIYYWCIIPDIVL